MLGNKGRLPPLTDSLQVVVTECTFVIEQLVIDKFFKQKDFFYMYMFVTLSRRMFLSDFW